MQWFDRTRFVLATSVLLVVSGFWAWHTMPEQEDPFFPYRNAILTIDASGVSATTLETRVARPLERALGALDEVATISVEVRDGAVSLDLELAETEYETDDAWRRVRDSIADTRPEFDALIEAINFDDRVQDTAGIVFYVETDRPLLEARRFALRARDRLYTLPEVREIALLGDPGEEVQIVIDPHSAAASALSPSRLAQQLIDATGESPSGALLARDFESGIDTPARFPGTDALRRFQVQVASGESVPLGAIGVVQHVTVPEVRKSFHIEGKRRVGLTLTIPPNEIRSVAFGERLRAFVEELNRAEPGFTLQELVFQPDWVKERRQGLEASLMLSALAVGMILVLVLSPRIALAVGATIPAITLSAIALLGIGGGIVHQMSIAGLVISLGLIVDNAIVVGERILVLAQSGRTLHMAIGEAVRELARPLATSSLTTIAAFLPMLLSVGSVADFVRLVPIVVCVAIASSYAYAMLFVPAIVRLAGVGGTANKPRGSSMGRRLAGLGARNPWRIVGLTLLVSVLLASVPEAAPGEFFPTSGRNQLVIDVELRAGSSHRATRDVIEKIESSLEGSPGIVGIASFAGHSGPRFYYNLSGAPSEPNVGRILLTLGREVDAPSKADQLNPMLARLALPARINARALGQGPPIESPIEVRLLSEDRLALQRAASDVVDLLRQEPSVRDPRTLALSSQPKLSWELDERVMSSSGVGRVELADYLQWRTLGLHAGALNIDGERVPLRLRASSNDALDGIPDLESLTIVDASLNSLPVSAFAVSKVVLEAPVLERRNGLPVAVVLADVMPGAEVDDILESLLSRITEIAGRHQAMVELGGEAEEEDDSGTALLRALPAGALLLLVSLLVHFNSFKLTALVLASIPLAMVGVPAALSIAGVGFGFMSILGLLALTGIVVNTAVIYVDRVLARMRDLAESREEAIAGALEERLRPILLTAGTTVIGMIPLTSSASPLWPPLAWTVIGGILSSTILTVFVMPAALRLSIPHRV